MTVGGPYDGIVIDPNVPVGIVRSVMDGASVRAGTVPKVWALHDPCHMSLLGDMGPALYEATPTKSRWVESAVNWRFVNYQKAAKYLAARGINLEGLTP